MPESNKVGVTNDTAQGFGTIRYGAVGTYKYKVTEVKGSIKGVTYDAAAHEVTVKVTDPDKNGKLKTEVVYEDAEKAYVEITNTYDATGSITLKGEKKMTGRTFRAGDSFTFTVTADEGTPLPDPAAVTVKPTSGSTVAVEFTAIKYGLADVGKTYKYTVTETGTNPGVTNDTGTHTVEVKITDNGDGTLKAEATYSDGKKLAFTNTYKAASTEQILRAKKVFEGGTLKAGAFSFELRDAEGKVLQTKKNDAEGAVAFDAIPYEFEDLGGETEKSFTYTIAEVNDGAAGVAFDLTVHKAVVTVKDDPVTGKLTASVVYDGAAAVPVFTNKSIDFRVTKVAAATGKGLDGAELAIVELDAQGKIVTNADGSMKIIHSWVSVAGKSYNFGSYLKSGTRYMLIETKAPTGYKTLANVAVTVKDDGTVAVSLNSVKDSSGNVIYLVVNALKPTVTPTPTPKTRVTVTPTPRTRVTVTPRVTTTVNRTTSAKTGDSEPVEVYLLLMMAAAAVLAVMRRKSRSEE